MDLLTQAASAVLLLLLALLVPARAAQARPHIVFIIADDMGWSDVGFHSGDVRTPNLDALAYHGTTFSRHYTLPLCTPSRTALLTGDYPIRYGMQTVCLPGVADGLPTEVKLMPQYFRDLGYKTHLVGKWHLGYETKAHLPTRRGFDSFFGYLNGYLGYWDGTHYYDDKVGRDFYRGETGAWREVYGRYMTEVLTSEAVDIITHHDDAQGLFLIVSENAVHTTLLDMVTEAPPHVSNYTERGILREMASSLDWSVGEIVSTLHNKGILNNTILVFISDNGAPSKNIDYENFGSNWPLRGQKTSPHEGGVRTVALMYSELLQNKSRVTDQYFHVADWFPTLYSAAGGKVKDLHYRDGIDQWRSLSSGTPGPRHEMLTYMNEVTGVEAYTSGRWKLVRNSNKSYDLYAGVSPDWMEYDADAVSNSSVGRILGGLPSTWADIKEALRVRSTCPQDRAVDCYTRHCLFDLEADPGECLDQAVRNPSLVGQLRSRIEYYRPLLVPQTPKMYNRKADPTNFKDYWGPWIPDDR